MIFLPLRGLQTFIPHLLMTINETNNDKGFLAYLALQALEAHFAAQGLKFDTDSDDVIHEALWDALDGVQVVSA